MKDKKIRKLYRQEVEKLAKTKAYKSYAISHLRIRMQNRIVFVLVVIIIVLTVALCLK